MENFTFAEWLSASASAKSQHNGLAAHKLAYYMRKTIHSHSVLAVIQTVLITEFQMFLDNVDRWSNYGEIEVSGGGTGVRVTFLVFFNPQLFSFKYAAASVRGSLSILAVATFRPTIMHRHSTHSMT